MALSSLTPWFREPGKSFNSGKHGGTAHGFNHKTKYRGLNFPLNPAFADMAERTNLQINLDYLPQFCLHEKGHFISYKAKGI